MLFQSQSLESDEAQAAIEEILGGKVSVEEIAGFLGALAGKGETVDEIVGCVRALRKQAVAVQPKREDLIDVCGTGGDSTGTFNISTCNALVLGAAGLGVCKHGNRAVSSQCGSADVLEALGLPIDLGPSDAARAIDEVGFAFLFAPAYHPGMKYIGPVRRALGVRTIFNILGPLANPCPVRYQVLGVYSSALLEPMAKTLLQLGVREALVVHGDNGLDEISLEGVTRVVHVKDQQLRSYELQASDFGLTPAPLNKLLGGTKYDNAKIILNILEGQPGPCRDIVVMNAAAALVIAGKAKNWGEGSEMAQKLLDSQEALRFYHSLKAAT